LFYECEYVLAISKGMRAVDVCTNKILQFFTGGAGMGVNATGTLGDRRSSAEDARIEAP